ncbi:DUF1707 domain-containing protein [Streptomyces sp. NBC_00083]|uniref:DUF1707 SHOCT-like domain-containing protein n=1 Tax=Streptomyces sp. NBC_00083 TaxID=2975647 RepID=UPI0022580FC7|nr:DUF1707 domain-containing protein [Streptomyces sp. NBC_00083]MCX5382216.1 DUF1707 domain-containing protein [Streptomyces sp. NBC_00083]
MRASDAERERVAESLREAVAEGRLDMEEFEQRLDAAYKARTHGELAPLVRDLPAPGTAGPAAAAPRRTQDDIEVHWPSRIGHPPTSRGGFAFWGGFARKGNWTVARKFTAFAMWGGGDIDLREARFEDRHTVLRLFTIMGGIGVTVPPELNVQVKGFGLMGGVGGSKANGEGTPGSPEVTIVAFALMGGIGVDRKLRRAQKERLRLEKRGEERGRKELG